MKGNCVRAGGLVEEGERVVSPLRQFGEPLVDLIRPTPYVSHQAFFDATAPHGLRYYWKSEYVPSLDTTRRVRPSRTGGQLMR